MVLTIWMQISEKKTAGGMFAGVAALSNFTSISRARGRRPGPAYDLCEFQRYFPFSE